MTFVLMKLHLIVTPFVFALHQCERIQFNTLIIKRFTPTKVANEVDVLVVYVVRAQKEALTS